MENLPLFSRIVLALMAGLLLVTAVQSVGAERRPGCDGLYAAPSGVGGYAAPPCGARPGS